MNHGPKYQIQKLKEVMYQKHEKGSESCRLFTILFQFDVISI